MRKNALCLALLLAASPAYADDVSVWLTSGMRSHHNDRAHHYHEDNYGGGVEIDYTPEVSLHAGTYLNSISRESNYLALGYTPYHVGDVHIGILFTAVDGYTRNNSIVVAPLPYASYAYKSVGINFIWVPTVVVAVQLKVKLGD